MDCMVVESTFELEFARIATGKVQSWLFLLQHNFHFKNEDVGYFVVVLWFVCTIRCFTKIFFRSNKSPNLKMFFCGSSFSSNLVLKYVKWSCPCTPYIPRGFGARIPQMPETPPPPSLDPGYASGWNCTSPNTWTNKDHNSIAGDWKCVSLSSFSGPPVLFLAPYNQWRSSQDL